MVRWDTLKTSIACLEGKKPRKKKTKGDPDPAPTEPPKVHVPVGRVEIYEALSGKYNQLLKSDKFYQRDKLPPNLVMSQLLWDASLEANVLILRVIEQRHNSSKKRVELIDIMLGGGLDSYINEATRFGYHAPRIRSLELCTAGLILTYTTGEKGTFNFCVSVLS